MSWELSDDIGGMSTCCSAAVYDPSGEGTEGVCMDCKEHCGFVEEEDDLQLLPDTIDLMTNPLRQHKLLSANRRYRELHADDYDWSDDVRESIE